MRYKHALLLRLIYINYAKQLKRIDLLTTFLSLFPSIPSSFRRLKSPSSFLGDTRTGGPR